MNAFEQITIDLTEPLANKGQVFPFVGEFCLPGQLLPYPKAQLQNTLVNLSVVAETNTVQLFGTVTCFVVGNCDRCLAAVERQFQLPFDQTFFKDCAPDEESYCYTGSTLNATKAVQDEIVLSLPTLLLCKPDCKGICPICGVDRNTTDCNCKRQKDNPFAQLNLKF